MEIPVHKRTRVSYEQRERMLEFMMAHPDFARNRMTGADATRKKIKLQIELATLLNSCATGASKSSDKWIKDWRSDVKAKASKIRCAQQQTAPLSAIEKCLMAFIGQETSEVSAITDTLESSQIPEYTVIEVRDEATEPIPVSENTSIPKKQDKLEEILETQAASMDQLSQSMNNLALAINNLAGALNSMASKQV